MTQPHNTPVVLYEGRHLRMVARVGWEYVERRQISGIVGLVAVTPDQRLVLVEQFRPPLDQNVIELPAGLAGDVKGREQEPLEQAARRELLEETGYEAAHLEYLFAGPASAGLSSEVITFFRATGLRKVGPGAGDGSERITVHEVPVADAPAWFAAQARAGRVIDAKVYVGLYFADDTPAEASGR